MSLISYIAFAAVNKLNLREIGGVNIGEYLHMDSGAKVTDGIYIGSLATATSKRCLDAHDIGAIINLSGTEFQSDRPVFNIIMDDADVTPRTMDAYIAKFAQGVDAIAHCQRNNKRVLINCAAGINRSATLIGFYLIEYGWTYDQAVAALTAANRSRGTLLLTNNSFRYLLQARDSFKKNFDKK
jgi:hypothetical protein